MHNSFVLSLENLGVLLAMPIFSTPAVKQIDKNLMTQVVEWHTDFLEANKSVSMWQPAKASWRQWSAAAGF
jgi:hypothetical protein